ncbi:SNF2 family Nterminal domain containing protein [Acanthamoeba castellanii str. Neff]|uniref:Chromatin-remodeling ATPase INO80 n=1 Tax=Acanthamoeba castellanii (strain ATCC 30010 / Neff) TaxID=1257118 RepID=L8HGM5_ACACF|nr:SNF2 family Nterminal domain containing protein [Acanthamoeba castellanii str. Neff]ELR24689.1 SNF2 family Nterminal domain containing protein [Acanthamoeba castellanii str. Neff]
MEGESKAAKRKLLEERADLRAQTQYMVPTYEELTERYEQTLALSASTKSMTDLFSVDRLLEAGVFAHMLEPILDDEDDEGISDDEGLFTLTDQTPTAESLARRRAELTWKGEITEKVYRALLKQHKTERRLRRLAEQGRLLEDGQRELKRLRVDSFLDDSNKEGGEDEEDSALLRDLKRRFGKPKRYKRISPSRYVLSPMGDTNFYIDAEDDYFSYEQAARYGYAEEGGKFREKPHKGDKYALLELAHLPPEMNKEEFARAWTQIVKRDMPRAHRQHVASRQATINNCKKLAVMCQKEMQRRAILLRRQGRDANLRAKKMAREMAVWWRKHDKEQRAALKKRAAEDRKKKKEEDERREAQRQQKKLNFLITQTELYSYFIGRKMPGQESSTATAEGVPAPPPPPPSTMVTPRVVGRHPPKAMQQAAPEAEAEDADLDPERAKEAAEIAWKRQMDKTAEFDKDQQKLREDAINFQAEENQQLALSPSIETIEKGTHDEGDLTHPSTMPAEFITVPKMFRGKLKMYQRKGLSWLVNLYEQGINGILADEMGLGKTVQSISFLTYLAEVKNIWGPFLVLAPTSTLHNWQQEITKFCPALKVLPYWGSQKDRKVIRKFWNPRHLNSPFHVLITNYNIVVRDESFFHRIKWEFMVLDEAQAIKSASSARWKSLLSFSCRNRLLLTGTPIQNSMAELWALLHFIMPTLFDSHEEFTEWFSKDIESHAENKSALNEHQLSRLHMVLKPFMLRRLKTDIEFEMPKKFEVEVSCGLSPRQKALYRAIKEKLNVAELLTHSFGDTAATNSDLMNLVMHLRKVCNHPELFERGTYRSPWQYRPPATTEQYSTPPKPSPVKLPKLLYQELDGVQELYNYPGLILSPRSAVMRDHLDIFSPEHIHHSLFPKNAPSKYSVSSLFSFTRFADMSPAELAWMAKSGALERWAVHINHTKRRHERLGAIYPHSTVSLFPSAQPTHRRRVGSGDITVVEEDESRVAPYYYPSAPINNRALLLLPTILNPLATSDALLRPIATRRLVLTSQRQRLEEMRPTIHAIRYYMPKVTPIITITIITIAIAIITIDDVMTLAAAAPHELYTSMKRQVNQQRSLMFNDWAQRLLVGEGAFRAPTRQRKLPRLLEEIKAPAPLREAEEQGEELREGLLSPLWVSDVGHLIADSSKMQVLDKLLIKLKAEGHRVLCYSQMTKMIDIMEDYLTFRGYRYIRLDGSSKLSERRDMVEDFQSNSDIFVFLLSTRAGGLGINLTSADTVIFYDSDWNPTNDAQAMDRCHRIGQTEDVTVYRLVTTGSIEERILKRAQEKSKIQNLVIAGGAFDRSALAIRPQEMVSLLLDEEGQKAQQAMAEAAAGGGAEDKGKEKVGGRRPGRKPREGIIMAAASGFRKRVRPPAPKKEPNAAAGAAGAAPPRKRAKTKKEESPNPGDNTNANGNGNTTKAAAAATTPVKKKRAPPAKRKAPTTPNTAKTAAPALVVPEGEKPPETSAP